MRLQALLVGWVALAAGAAGAPAHHVDSSYSATIFATVGHSEWCPHGTVRLNLASGRYTLRAPAAWRTCRRPFVRSRIGTAVLSADDLAAVRAAYQGAASAGLNHPDCRHGRRPGVIVVSNGGTPLMRLTARGRTRSPPNDLTCWSEPAMRLHRVLEEVFHPRSDARPLVR